MQRQHPFLSPTGIILTLLLTAILALLLAFTGGQMFSPGALTAQVQEGSMLGGVASHAEITTCRTCHQPLKTNQATLCLQCHTEIQTQLTTEIGLHAKFDPKLACFTCHSDHQGADFDPIRAGLDRFDHSVTSFSLIWHQVDYTTTPIQCANCHPGDDFSLNQQTCVDCHASHDPAFMTEHQQPYGNDCLACHDGVDRMANFDHTQTGFPLEGQHADTKCVDCHTDHQFAELPTQCVACHTEPAVHAGLFDTQCQACHTPHRWTPATLGSAAFDHSQARFTLTYHKTDFSGAVLQCATCHQTDLRKVDLNVCTTCHAQADALFMAAHEQQFGSDCLACHDGVDRMHNFDHTQFFALDGHHAEIECVACHTNQQFAGTPSACASCHEEPSIHAGVFGVQCENCHSTTAWAPASLKFHTFPLDHGGEGMIACQTCHITLAIPAMTLRICAKNTIKKAFSTLPTVSSIILLDWKTMTESAWPDISTLKSK